MLDIQFIRENPGVVKKACEDKQLEPEVVNELLEIDEQRRELIAKTDELRRQINANADDIKAEVQKGGQPAPDKIKQGKDLKQQLKEVEPKQQEVEARYQQLLMSIPNIPAEDVPYGPDESGNKQIRTEGAIPKFDFDPKPHQEIMESLGWLDTKRAVRIGGFRSYFLQGDALLLEQAILRYALDMLIKEGFKPTSAPIIVNEETLWGTGYFPWGREDHYKTQDDKYLTGTAEVALTAFHADEVLNEKDLPIKMVGISPCFRREVGSYGQDTQGIVRVHTFNKVEMVVYTIADEKETISWHETMTSLSERLLQDLKLPYQVLLMCTGDMGAGQRKKYDIETWFPAQEKYRETHSASYFNDFQSRRLNIKYNAKDGSKKYVYTLNNTMAATPRLLAAIVENYQQADGSVKIPKVLEPYMNIN